jgi:hypothetical protein
MRCGLFGAGDEFVNGRVVLPLKQGVRNRGITGTDLF